MSAIKVGSYVMYNNLPNVTTVYTVTKREGDTIATSFTNDQGQVIQAGHFHVNEVRLATPEEIATIPVYEQDHVRINRAFSSMPFNGDVQPQWILENDSKDAAFKKIARNLERLKTSLVYIGESINRTESELTEYRKIVIALRALGALINPPPAE